MQLVVFKYVFVFIYVCGLYYNDNQNVLLIPEDIMLSQLLHDSKNSN